MSLLMHVGELLIREKLISQTSHTAFSARQFLKYCIALMALIGLGMFCYGLFLCLERYYSLEIAFMAIGLLLILLVVAGGMAALYAVKQKEKRILAIKDTIIADFEQTLTKMDDEMTGLIRNNPHEALLLSLLFGMIAGTRIPGIFKDRSQ